MSISLLRLHEHEQQSEVLGREEGCMAGFYGVLSLLGVAEEGWGTGCFVPHSQVLLPICLFYVDVLRFSVGITKWNSTESFWR